MGHKPKLLNRLPGRKPTMYWYFFANRPALYHQVQGCFKKAQAQQFQGINVSYDHRIEKGHHRTETRQEESVPVSAIGELYQPRLWAGLQSVVMVVRVRQLWNKTTRETQFYLTSLHSDAQLLGRAIRKHWGIENEAHWTQGLYLCVRCLPHSFKPQSSELCSFTTHCSQCSRVVNRLTNVVSVKK